MAARTKSAQTATRRDELVITRVFDAPPELVWKAWTDPEHFQRWWGPRDFTAPVCRIDLRVGGRYHWCMRGPDGKDFWTTGVYREIVPLQRLVYTDSFADAAGNALPPSAYGFTADWPAEQLVTVTLAPEGSGTRMTLRHAGLPGGMHREMAGAGWSQSFDKLAASLAPASQSPERGSNLTVTLPSDTEIVMTRWFNAPRRLVFEAHSSCEHLKHWWGPRRYAIVSCEMDFRPGGAWRVVHRGKDGREFGFRGHLKEIVAPERIVRTFEFEGAPGHISQETLTLAEYGGGTTLVVRSVFTNKADRDAMLKSGMEDGAKETLDRLGEYLETRRGLAGAPPGTA
ncbi:MAG TPA: SRPBCC domain-containing protein [Gemmatimonadales bacterium]|nr:SRPBCC domain-containing protein [Gemmatimonadales bacterium]